MEYMSVLDNREVRRSLIDFGRYEIDFKNGELLATDTLFQEVASLLDEKNGYVVFYGVNNVLKNMISC